VALSVTVRPHAGYFPVTCLYAYSFWCTRGALAVVAQMSGQEAVQVQKPSSEDFTRHFSLF
jgi:hypothetical protein